MVDNSWTEIVKLSFTEDVCIIVALALTAFRKSKTVWFFSSLFPVCTFLNSLTLVE